MNFLIIEVHLIILPNRWNITPLKIKNILKKNNNKKYGLIPLYFTSDFEDNELRICFQVKNLQTLEKFIIDRLLKISGIQSIRVRLTLNGKIFPEGIKQFVIENSNLISIHVFLGVNPKWMKNVWGSLNRLKSKWDVFPTWIFRDFYDYNRDITLRIIGKDLKDIKRYIDTQINTIKGITSMKFKIMQSITRLLSKKTLLKIAEEWIKKY